MLRLEQVLKCNLGLWMFSVEYMLRVWKYIWSWLIWFHLTTLGDWVMYFLILITTRRTRFSRASLGCIHCCDWLAGFFFCLHRRDWLVLFRTWLKSDIGNQSRKHLANSITALLLFMKSLASNVTMHNFFQRNQVEFFATLFPSDQNGFALTTNEFYFIIFWRRKFVARRWTEKTGFPCIAAESLLTATQRCAYQTGMGRYCHSFKIFVFLWES